jgi:hypothetical protein
VRFEAQQRVSTHAGGAVVLRVALIDSAICHDFE